MTESAARNSFPVSLFFVCARIFPGTFSDISSNIKLKILTILYLPITIIKCSCKQYYKIYIIYNILILGTINMESAIWQKRKNTKFV